MWCAIFLVAGAAFGILATFLVWVRPVVEQANCMEAALRKEIAFLRDDSLSAANSVYKLREELKESSSQWAEKNEKVTMLLRQLKECDEAKCLLQEASREKSQEIADLNEVVDYYGEAIVNLRERAWEASLPAFQIQLDPPAIAQLKHDFDLVTQEILESDPPGPTWLFPQAGATEEDWSDVPPPPFRDVPEHLMYPKGK
jgi:hypothetical protein